jgi:hypothetical protein
MKSAPPPIDALVARPGFPAAPGPLDDVALQKLWLATQRREWRSLAVVSTGAEVNTLAVANLLARIAWSYRGHPTAVLDFRDLTLRMVEHQIRELNDQLAHERVIIALRSVAENPTTIAVASMTDAAVLCMRLGKSDMRAAATTLSEIGREKFLGSILVKPEKAA